MRQSVSISYPFLLMFTNSLKGTRNNLASVQLISVNCLMVTYPRGTKGWTWALVQLYLDITPALIKQGTFQALLSSHFTNNNKKVTVVYSFCTVYCKYKSKTKLHESTFIK